MAKGKKSGAFLNQKKKAGSADFSNPKAKVGRKVKRRVGETDASFQTRQLSIGEQSIARQKKDGAKTSKRGLTCDEHLGQLGHHNDKARAAAAEGLADICAAHADEAWRLFGPLLCAPDVFQRARINPAFQRVFAFPAFSKAVLPGEFLNQPPETRLAFGQGFGLALRLATSCAFALIL